jgi:hypothetical protein
MDNPKKLATKGTQDEAKQTKKHNTICVGQQYMQANIYKCTCEESYSIV